MEYAWYSKRPAEVLHLLHTHESGLTWSEAKHRLKKYGYNQLPVAKPDTYAKIFLRQFQNPLIYLLLAVTVIVFLLGETTDAGMILFVLLFNAIVGALQEGRAQNTLAALKNFAETNAVVFRDHKEFVIRDVEVVPGDILILREGDKVPADARLLEIHNLALDEAALTGESLPVEKANAHLSTPDLPAADQKNMVFKGTHVVAGSARAVVVATGVETAIGQISRELSLIDKEIPLKKEIRELSRLIMLITLAVTVGLFVLGLLAGETAREMFATAVSIAVSIIPEGLPIVVTLVLASGVWRMSRRQALVKKLQAVEVLGQARVIAVDKTGTLTKNQMAIERVWLSREINDEQLPGRLAAFCANSGDPTEVAINDFAKRSGFDPEQLEQKYPRLDEIPFGSHHKYHAVLHKYEGQFLSVVGAPESIMKLADIPDAERQRFETEIHKLSSEGFRVLAFAYRRNFNEPLKIENINNLRLAGLYGLRDVLRPEAYRAVTAAQAAGLRVVMITGDHAETAAAIGRELGILRLGDKVLTGEEIEKFNTETLPGALEGVTVFARVTPEHKLHIIQAYKKRGEIVAMTGDGVNDAPSLVAADLGVAMGQIGTEVAKEAADIVLLDDNFGSILAAVEEGRNIFKTLKKVLLYLFSTGWGELLTIAGALLAGLPLPLLAAQIIWLNLVTDGFLVVALGLEPKESDLLSRNFVRPKRYLLDRRELWRMIWLALPMAIGTLAVFSNYLDTDMAKAWTVALTTLAVFQWFNAFNCRHEEKSIFQLNPFANKPLIAATAIVILLQLAAVYTPFMQKILNTTALSAADWFLIIPVAFSVIVVEELRKFFHRKLTVTRPDTSLVLERSHAN